MIKRYIIRSGHHRLKLYLKDLIGDIKKYGEIWEYVKFGLNHTVRLCLGVFHGLGSSSPRSVFGEELGIRISNIYIYIYIKETKKCFNVKAFCELYLCTFKFLFD